MSKLQRKILPFWVCQWILNQHFLHLGYQSWVRWKQKKSSEQTQVGTFFFFFFMVRCRHWKATNQCKPKPKEIKPKTSHRYHVNAWEAEIRNANAACTGCKCSCNYPFNSPRHPKAVAILPTTFRKAGDWGAAERSNDSCEIPHLTGGRAGTGVGWLAWVSTPTM